MTDAEMIHWLRNSTVAPPTDLMRYRIANRLEQLTTPDGKAPISETRLEQIGQTVEGLGARLAQMGNPPPESFTRYDALRDLLTAHDFERKRAALAESLIADLLSDEHEQCVAAGVAKALGVLHRLRDEEDRGRHHVQSIVECIAAVVIGCGPGLLPPHLVTLEECRRYRLALERIIVAADTDPGGLDQRTHVLRIAREALGETP